MGLATLWLQRISGGESCLQPIITHARASPSILFCDPASHREAPLRHRPVEFATPMLPCSSRIDLDRRRIDIVEAVSDPRGRVICGTPKSHERRSVPFPDFPTEALTARSRGKQPDDLVFMAPDGGVLRNGNFRSRTFNPALAVVRELDPSFPKVTPHDLRHTAASLAVSVGANVKAVQRMLGHASAAMTLDVYTDLFDDDLDAVATALNETVLISDVFKMCSGVESEVSSTPEKRA